jgi:GGDEF domain-containing protein
MTVGTTSISQLGTAGLVADGSETAVAVTIPVTASVGAAACAERGLSAGLAAADAAMYQAKNDGGGYRTASPCP